jgi:hypothetical protein
LNDGNIILKGGKSHYQWVFKSENHPTRWDFFFQQPEGKLEFWSMSCLELDAVEVFGILSEAQCGVRSRGFVVCIWIFCAGRAPSQQQCPGRLADCAFSNDEQWHISDGLPLVHGLNIERSPKHLISFKKPFWYSAFCCTPKSNGFRSWEMTSHCGSMQGPCPQLELGTSTPFNWQTSL